nr:MAG TPA: hypothetical protein [Caudoviricetes sp.]
MHQIFFYDGQIYEYFYLGNFHFQSYLIYDKRGYFFLRILKFYHN